MPTSSSFEFLCPECSAQCTLACAQGCEERQIQALCSICQKEQLVSIPASAPESGSTRRKSKERENFKVITIPAGTVVGSGGEFDCHLIGLPKGAKQVLMERGRWTSLGAKPIKNCQHSAAAKRLAAEQKQQSQDQLEAKLRRFRGRRVHDVDFEDEVDQEADVDDDEGDVEFKHSATCCITGALEHEEDFHQIQQDKTALFKLIQQAGHLCFFLPKFHSELNPIERYWAVLKSHTRKNCRMPLASTRMPRSCQMQAPMPGK